MTIGQHINLARYKRNITLDKLAEKSNVSKNTIVGWIYRGAHPDIELLIAVADALQMSLDELVGREPIKEKTETKRDPVRACAWRGELQRN